MDQVQNAIDQILGAMKTRDKANDAALAELRARLKDVELTDARDRGGKPLAPNQQRHVIAQMLKGREGAVADLANIRGKVTLLSAEPTSVKDLTSTQGSPDSPGSGFDVEAYRDKTIYLPPPRPTTLLDVLPVEPMSASNTYEFARIEAAQDSPSRPDAGADAQEFEGAEKSEGLINVILERAEVATIAMWSRASRQVLNDVVALTGALSQFFANNLRSRLEREIINGPGGKMRILGLYTQAQTYVPTATHAADQISEALAFLEDTGFAQPFVVMNPIDWHRLRTVRTTEGAYVAGSWNSPASANAWGAPIIRNAAVTAGDVLIVDRSAATYIDRQQTTIQLSTEDRDNFVKNMVTILGETRGTLAVTQPAGLLKLDLAAS